MNESDGFTIRVRYSCFDCGLLRAECDVRARGDEDVLVWMEATIRQCGVDHHRRGPHCQPTELHDLMIPMTDVDRIGGPGLQ